MIDSRSIAVLYPGEMGAALARLLCERGHRVFTTLHGRTERTKALARESGVVELSSFDELITAADIVFSVVPPGAALETAARFRAHADRIRPGTVYVDVNSISPATASLVDNEISRTRGRFVDGAVRGLASRLRTHGALFLSGEAAPEVASLFGTQLRTKVIGTRHGAASALKMFQGGLNKGLCAVFLELALAAERAGLLNEVLTEYQEFYPSVMDIVDRLVPTYSKHARRRSQEMSELAGMLQGFDSPAGTAEAARALFRELSCAIEDGRDPLPSLVAALGRARESR